MTDEDGWRLPDALVARAREYAAGGGGPVPVPRVAATVVLLRPADSGFEVYLLRRAASMAFASGMYAFPGGSVDPADATADLAWSGPAPDEWARRLGRSREEAQAVVCAAVREVFEETGVLLAGPGGASDDDRRALVGRELGLAELLSRRGLVLRSDLLGAWARWVTPEFEARRFDTYFFVAALPDDQRAQDVSGEADYTTWMRPAEAVARYEAGELAMLPPTIVMLGQLSAYRMVADVLRAAADRDAAAAVKPRAEVAPDGTVRLKV
ncbi:NUDIX hydrolase [Phytohabitans aurantiacus]|uniref:Nudix hydrolase domain-containing protein n=1 Tax=Phytohabitans aurantiacus TaxID=3016789 RepID=A0ABQ5QS46_9ACTN|nr:NUDIX domain-containing protein [Phytohabitans aurantiacus]GLH97435.1 hypothetical protein Pa4123_27100 [Phytohabitans aurantiacus]